MLDTTVRNDQYTTKFKAVDRNSAEQSFVRFFASRPQRQCYFDAPYVGSFSNPACPEKQLKASLGTRFFHVFSMMIQSSFDIIMPSHLAIVDHHTGFAERTDST